ncbi:MAG: hypothetical protein ASARMPREDX12_008181 [Alectoria sarmentosa]|nr:MAG: hypothetical protein ASARMPREDX12_008181 [Alectoria sarmentosa]CAD6579087.1 MAG: hypothetical protein ASARMPRED_008951 [Alectoria sarmentosa]
MPRSTNKRKTVEEDSGNEARHDKTRRMSKNTVKFANTVQGQSKDGLNPLDTYTDSKLAVTFGEYQKPKSILKTSSTSLPTAPGSPDTASSSSQEPSEQPEEEEFDTEEADDMSKLAAAAIQMAEDAHTERLEQDLAAIQKELAFTKSDLEDVRFYEKILLQSRDKAACALADANKRSKAADAEVKEALLANGKLENKCRTLEGQLNRANEQVEELQRELVLVREEKAKTEKLLVKKTAKEGSPDSA